MRKTVTIEGINVKPREVNGEMKKSVGILIKKTDGGEMWINTLLDYHPTWQKGDTIEVDVYSKEWNGKTFWNFRPLEKTNTNLEERVKVLETQVKLLQGMMQGKVEEVAQEFNGEVKKEITLEDLNF